MTLHSHDDLDDNGFSLRATLHAKLGSLSQAGYTVHFHENDDSFAIDVDGLSVTFEGFGHAGPTFTVETADGVKREVQYDASQMRFADNSEAYWDIVTDPLGWCRTAVMTAEEMAGEAA
ncbi:hypothetical protein [Aureimonas sp. Leaf324]|uniref:hypothetical protein n=1 Tax=Aureimonas sp. Leaf324 TaxID=1736336 RepID=UPI0006F975EE|nr:hypothetical protein [Aureimonas sp. Leaf324]KQQ90973.1 hypothetical protein ASF65_00060 [Aureimonas sp. Leaf324]